MANTIYDRCGGFSTVRKVVSSFYDKVLDSPELQGYFAGVEMSRLIDHQTKFIASVMGGPASFSDEQLQRAHSRLGISGGDFEEVAELLEEAMEDHGLAPDDIAAVMAEVSSRQAFIVAHKG